MVTSLVRAGGVLPHSMLWPWRQLLLTDQPAQLPWESRLSEGEGLQQMIHG